ncbi:MAG: Mpv17/PMP22 family protein [Salinivirgaceae bacterium]
MKQKDLIFIIVAALVFSPFFISEAVFNAYDQFNTSHGMVMAFLKFAILATLGEVIGLRIKTGNYSQKGFGIIPRAIVWGVLGLTIKMAFVVFATGIPQFLAYLGLENAVSVMKQGFTMEKLLVAFAISAAMNIFYAPVMMTFHKITDTHILKNNGTVAGLFRPIQFKEIFTNLDWGVQWGFVFKKTIPIFWIPAHTITFLLPANYQVLFAAVLGIMLGVFLAVAAQLGKK